MSNPTDVYADLKTEGEILDQLVAGLDPAQWDLPTPAPGWTIKHQIAHLSQYICLYFSHFLFVGVLTLH